jgi:hypothetical protein
MTRLRKRAFILFWTAILCQSAQAQYKKGDMLLNVGIGAANNSYRAVPGVSFEYGFGKFFSAGLQTDMYTYRTGRGEYTYTTFPTSLRGSYHFGKHFLKIKTLDLYGGVALGYFALHDDVYYPKKHPKYYLGDHDGLYAGLYAGARYYMQPRFAFFAEAGHKVSWLKAGVTFRFY